MTFWRAEPGPWRCARCALITTGFVGLQFALGGRLQTAQAGLPFTEESLSRGISYVTPYGATGSVPYGYGLAFADLDGDGDPDLVTTGSSTAKIGLYENLGGTFINRYSISGIPLMQRTSGVVAFDADGDGDLDLYVTQWGLESKLFRNNGSFSFTDITTAANLVQTGSGTGPTIADYDGDGWLDLYVSFYGEPNHLYRNNGGLGFTNVSATAGISGVYNTLQSTFFDMDMDGDKDLYESNDKRSPYNTYEHNRLYENVDGVFVDISAESGADINIMSMNVGLADLDHNGFLDIYCTNVTIEPLELFLPNVLLMNAGNGTFTEQQQAAGVESFRFGWGAVFLDFNNDKSQDLYVCNQIGENRLYVNKGLWPLVDEAAEYGVNLGGDTRCVAVADIDADGDLDMVVQKYEDRLHLYINHEGQLRNWLRVVPVAPLPNRQSIGAIVRARTGELWQMQELVAGSNYKVQNELVAHFGMDEEQSADEIVVQWSDGAMRTLTSIPTNEVHKVYHPDLLGDQNEDGAINAIDTLAFIAALVNPNFPDPTRFDFNGNGAADGDDIQGMIDRIINAP